jgi:hypothetical protein
VTLAVGTDSYSTVNKLKAAADMKCLRSSGEELSKWVLRNGKMRRSLKEIAWR